MPTLRSALVVVALATLLLLAGLAPSLCAAQQAPATLAPSVNNTIRGLKDPVELAAFLNVTLNDELATYHIPGATVAVVKDGKLFFAKGYGYADLENKTPVESNATLFKIGSLTKLFTWTAVMQLVEEGKIDLHADVNTYLPANLKIPATYPQPVTMENLMTHTAGFEEVSISSMTVYDPKDIQPLGTALAQTAPARVWPPGQVWSYSNWGAGLAGYIVQEVSGIPFNQYVKEKIFTPLGMNNTTIEQPVPSPLVENVSKTYAYNNGTFTQTKDYFIGVPPGGAIHSTAGDMAKFMIAQLQNGTYNGARILNTSTAQDMHRAHFTPDAYTSLGLGFFIGNENNESSISHGGATNYFYSECMLWPDSNTGLFVSYNSVGGSIAQYDLVQKFLDHYYPITRSRRSSRTSTTRRLLRGSIRARGAYTPLP